MNYIEIGKIPPNSKNELSTPEQLVENLKSLIGEKFPLTGKPRTDGSNFRKMITNHLLSNYIPKEAVEYEIVPPKQKGVPSFLREYIDTYIVTSGVNYNLQVWNRNPNSSSVQVDLKNGETLLASDVRFVLGKINADEIIESIVIMTPEYIENRFGKFGKPTVKQQLIISNKKREEILKKHKKKTTEKALNIDNILFNCRDYLRAARNSGSFFEKRDMMLTLVFLRFIGEKYEDGIENLKQTLKEQGLDPEDENIRAAFFDDATFADGTYNLPPEARWSTIISTPAPQLNVALDTALQRLEEEDPQLKGCFVKGTFTARNLAANDIKKIVDEVNKISHKTFGEEKDLIGRVYEYFLKEFAVNATKEEGEFYTPHDVVQLIATMIEPYDGTLYDKTTPRLIQFHILKNAVNPPFLGGFLFSPLWRHRQNGILARTDYTFWRYSVTIEKLSLQSRAIVKMYKNVRVRLKGLTLD